MNVGWIYGLHGGLLKDLNATVSRAAEVGRVGERAIEALGIRTNEDD